MKKRFPRWKRRRRECSGRIAALEEGASFTEELVLPVSAWQNKTAVFDSAALAALSSLTAGSFVGAAPAAGYAAAFLKNNVRLVSVGAGTLTFTADTVPSTELARYFDGGYIRSEI